MTACCENFQLIAKPSGSVCNIDCSYCFYLEKKHLYPERNENWRMDGETLENYVRKNIHEQTAPVVDFIWQGGEPTMLGISFFKQAMELQRFYGKNKQINNYFQTNGINLNDEWAEFLKENNFLVGLSIDGNRINNDAHRLTRAGKSTFDAVLNGVDVLRRHKIEFNTLTVVNSENVHNPLDVYNFLKRIGSRYMQFIPLVERRAVEPDENGLILIQPDFSGQCSVTEWSVPARAYGKFLNVIFDYWVKNDLGSTFVVNFEQTMAKITGKLSACVINETCGRNLIIEANGDVYSCDHFVYPEHKLGNINNDKLIEMINSHKNKEFGNRKLENLDASCINCSVRTACNGGCPKHRFEIASNGMPNKNYFCDGMSMHLQHAIPIMNILLDSMRKQAPLNHVRKVIKAHYIQA